MLAQEKYSYLQGCFDMRNKANESLMGKLRTSVQRFTFHRHWASLTAANLRFYFSKKGNEREQITLKTLSDFKKDNRSADWQEDKTTIKDLLYSRAYYAVSGEEYYLFGLDQSKNEEKRDFVGWHELDYYYSVLNRSGAPEIFEYKEKTYAVFQKYYKRELILFVAGEQKESFLSFFDRHASGIIKPVNDFGGHGIQIVSVNDQSPEEIWNRVSGQFPFILEELIVQAPEMNAFYPHAVNTIRYNTFFHEGKLTRLQAVFRIGRGGSVVDNATSGGIYALVDTETGRILGPARSDLCEYFECHPDTGAKFEGSLIPRWNELNALLEELVRVVPEQKQVGWDFALSEKGWVMVEGNTTPALQSFDLDHGLRPLLKGSFGKAVKMWA